jgi:hypothetical protein
MDEDLIEQVDLASNKHCLIYQVPCNNQAISIHSKHTHINKQHLDYENMYTIIVILLCD